MTTPEGEKILTTGEVGEIFGVSSNTVLRWIKDGKLEAFRTLGTHGHYRVTMTAVRAFGSQRYGPGNADVELM